MASNAKLLVLPDATFVGTVGGGCLEAEVYAAGTELLRNGGARLEEFHLNEVEAETGGHVCGGTVEVFIRAFEADADTIAFVEAAVALQDSDPELLLTTRLDPAAAAHLLLGSRGIEAELGDTGGIEFSRHRGFSDDRAARWFPEPVRPAPLLLVFGAGHCGVAIGEAAAGAGFRVWMLEDRPAFLQPQAMPWADQLHRVDFTALPELPLGSTTSVVIVTRGHDHDLVVLRQLLDTETGYLGMIGSQRKRALFRTILGDEGRDLDAFERLRSPMGLDIGAETPAEIAVSVVAELVASRRQQSTQDESRLRALRA